jgi:hypothetical protein
MIYEISLLTKNLTIKKPKYQLPQNLLSKPPVGIATLMEK